MTTILVTGATGTLGRPTVERLREAGHDVRALSRGTGPGLVTGDLLTGAGLSAALAGAATVLHLSTGKRDVAAAQNLVGAARQAGVAHLVLISIVGIDDIPFPYYRGKVAIESVVVGSGLPFTILRATQFHQFIEGGFTAQRMLPVIFAPSFSVQPVAVEEVADRLTDLAGGDPAGRVADLGGPQKRSIRDLANAWRRAVHSRRAVVPLSLPGKTFAAFAAGHGMTASGSDGGTVTFDEYLAAKY
jgi:uncharacterized protein YbjT (DUF2867 family)